MRRPVFWVPALLLLACGGCPGSDPVPEAPSPAADPSAGATESTESTATAPAGEDPLGIGLPDHRSASETTLRIVNDRAETIRFVISFGRGQPFAILPRDGEREFRLGGEGPVVAGPSCDCRCGFDCLECEPPLYQEAEVEPGGHFDFAWSGRVRVPEGHCFHPYGAPTGPRTFEACLGDFGTQPRDCVRVDTELPTDSPIEFHFGAPGAAEPAAP